MREIIDYWKIYFRMIFGSLILVFGTLVMIFGSLAIFFVVGLI